MITEIIASCFTSWLMAPLMFSAVICCIAQIKCLGQLLIQFRTFVKIQLFCLDNHLSGSCHLLGLNIIVSGNFCHNRNYILIQSPGWSCHR